MNSRFYRGDNALLGAVQLDVLAVTSRELEVGGVISRDGVPHYPAPIMAGIVLGYQSS